MLQALNGNFMHRYLLLFVFFISTNVLAQDPCSDAYEEGGMAAWKVCKADLADSSDVRMESVYNQLLSNLVYPEYLVESQKQWKVYADKHCSFVATGSLGGSGHSAQISICREDMLETRIKELKEFLACRDMGCPPLK